MTRVREAAGGGRVVEVAPGRLPGWLNRFAMRHGGVVQWAGAAHAVTVRAADGERAVLAVPFAPMARGDAEPVEALLTHISRLGRLAVVLMRGGAFSVGVAEGGQVLAGSTDARYAQGRSAAGGWSQQRFARRRDNQRRDARRVAAAAALRVIGPYRSSLSGVVVGGDRRGVADVLAEQQLNFLAALPRREFADIPEPRRAVLDAVALRALSVEVTVYPYESSPPAEA